MNKEELEKKVADLKQGRENLLAYIDKRIAVEARYENSLEWIRYLAGLHYMGDAFDPEHMRALANIAADALNYNFKSEDSTEFEDDGKFLPAFEESTEKAKKKARKLADKLHLELDENFKPYYAE